MTTPTTRCIACRQSGRNARRCPDCRASIHPRGQADHACPPTQARVATLTAERAARLVRDRVGLMLEIDSACGSPQTGLAELPRAAPSRSAWRLRSPPATRRPAIPTDRRDEPVTRLSGDEWRDGHVWNGFDYALQVWVVQDSVRPCGHSPAMSRHAPCCVAFLWPAGESIGFRARRAETGSDAGPLRHCGPPARHGALARVPSLSAPRTASTHKEVSMLSPFAERLRDYLRAGYPALAVLTHEEERLLGDLRTLRAIGWSFVAWSIARGWVDADGRALNQGQRDPVRAFEALASVPEKTLAVFFDLHPYLAQIPELVRTVRDTLPTAKATQRPLLFCSPELAVPVEWEKDMAVLDYPLPSRAALGGLLDELVGPARVTVPTDIRDTMLEAARGLTWNEAENAFALALMRDRERVEAMPGTVQHEKTTRVRTSGLLDLVTPAETLEDVGGLAPLKAWLGRQGALLAGAADALAWGFAPRDLPKGVLLLGVPGTGKEPGGARDRRDLALCRSFASRWRASSGASSASRRRGPRAPCASPRRWRRVSSTSTRSRRRWPAPARGTSTPA